MTSIRRTIYHAYHATEYVGEHGSTETIFFSIHAVERRSLEKQNTVGVFETDPALPCQVG